jgi:hypothetical protein
VRLILLVLIPIALSGCMRTYTVFKSGDYIEANQAHYVIVQAKPNGNMKVYDCRSAPADTWDPACKRVDLKK